MQISAISKMNWRTRRRIRTISARVFAYLFTTVLALVFAAPFVWMFVMSLENPVQLTTYPPSWIPKPVMWDNYLRAMSMPRRPFGLYLENSLIYTLTSTAGVVISSSIVAFGFARLSFKGRDALFVLVLSTMMLPGQVTLIPRYIFFQWLGWIDSMRPLVVPSWFGSAFDIFLLRQFFLTIPRELDEAAILDGCDYISILWRIIIPLAKPALVTVIAFSIVATWNDFMGPLIFLNTNEKMTAAVGLSLFRQMAGESGFTDLGLVMAASVTTLIPMIILFMVAQSYFVTGITMTGMKEG
jgi:multiple sugar transport system permease protein